MLREDAAESIIVRTNILASEFRSGALKCLDILTINQDAKASRESGSGSRSGFLSESEAATYLGMSTDELVGLRKFDLAVIEDGFKPQGPTPLWWGGACRYATETLDEWMRNQSPGYVEQGTDSRREMNFQ